MDFMTILSNILGELFAPTTAASALAATGLNLHVGMSGLMNLGQAGFMLLGVTFYTWTILLLGGAATIMGPVLGSCVLWVLLTAVKETMRLTNPTTASSSNHIEAHGWVILGVALMLLEIFRPQCILGNKKELAFNC